MDDFSSVSRLLLYLLFLLGSMYLLAKGIAKLRAAAANWDRSGLELWWKAADNKLGLSKVAGITAWSLGILLLFGSLGGALGTWASMANMTVGVIWLVVGISLVTWLIVLAWSLKVNLSSCAVEYVTMVSLMLFIVSGAAVAAHSQGFAAGYWGGLLGAAAWGGLLTVSVWLQNRTGRTRLADDKPVN